MGILKDYDIKIPQFKVAKNATDVKEVFDSGNLGKDVVIKAQVLAGGRGKGSFSSGMRGGVKMAFTSEEAETYAKNMLGHRLYTKQTGREGKPCNEVTRNSDKLFIFIMNLFEFYLKKMLQIIKLFFLFI